jgi:hypothetical protein
LRTRGRLFQTGPRFVEIQITPTGRPTAVCPSGIPGGDGVLLDRSGLGPADDCRGDPLRFTPSGRGISAFPMQPWRPSDRTLGIALRSVSVPNTIIYRTRSPPPAPAPHQRPNGHVGHLGDRGLAPLDPGPVVFFASRFGGGCYTSGCHQDDDCKNEFAGLKDQSVEFFSRSVGVGRS